MIDNKTKRERLQKWCAALRSGDYTQGHGEFHRPSSTGMMTHCCLGVAELDAGLNLAIDDYDFIQDYFDLDRDNIGILWYMNDVSKLPFPQIADYIEQNLMPGGE